MLRRLFKKQPDKLTDQELLQKFQKTGNSEFLGILYTRYTHLIFGVCMKYYKDEDTAQDATLQLFEVLLEKLPQSEISNFKGWLYQVSRNHCLMDLRKRKTAYKHYENYGKETQTDMELEQSTHLLDEDDSHEDKLAHLKDAIDKLKEEQKQCVKMFFLEEKSYQQIADETQFSLKQVKSHLQNGKRNLKKQLLETGLWSLFLAFFH